ncbi:hypothetical protein BGP_0695 [Beggiatoa sp. PS]|nr:hypothetical protein BGP_0695 [Beggiatoa sp. PS]
MITDIIALFCYKSIFGKKKAPWHKPKGLKKVQPIFEQDYTDYTDKQDSYQVFNPVNLLIRFILFKTC